MTIYLLFPLYNEILAFWALVYVFLTALALHVTENGLESNEGSVVASHSFPIGIFARY